jgi:hypothetical protein
MSVFVYRPCSGDRVFAERPTPEVAVVRHANGCRHILGGYHINWRTAEPGVWWRDLARIFARQAVHMLGGIAWDEQGEVNLVVPAYAEVINLMERLSDKEGRTNEIRIVATQLRRPDLEVDEVCVKTACLEAGVWHRASPVQRDDGFHVLADTDSVWLMLGRDVIDRCSWPAEWSSPEITPEPLELEEEPEEAPEPEPEQAPTVVLEVDEVVSGGTISVTVPEPEPELEPEPDELSCTLQDILAVPYATFVGSDDATLRCVKNAQVVDAWAQAGLKNEDRLTWPMVHELDLPHKTWLWNLMRRVQDGVRAHPEEHWWIPRDTAARLGFRGNPYESPRLMWHDVPDGVLRDVMRDVHSPDGLRCTLQDVIEAEKCWRDEDARDIWENAGLGNEDTLTRTELVRRSLADPETHDWVMDLMRRLRERRSS